MPVESHPSQTWEDADVPGYKRLAKRAQATPTVGEPVSGEGMTPEEVRAEIRAKMLASRNVDVENKGVGVTEERPKQRQRGG